MIGDYKGLDHGDKNRSRLVNEIKELIFKTSLEVTKNVNKAAIEHVLKQMPEIDMAQPMQRSFFE